MSGDRSAHEWGSAPDFVGPRHAYREALMLRLLPDLSGRRVLNAGCGAGSLTMAMLDAGADVTSVDASERFVAHLTERVAARGLTPRAPVLLADLERPVPFEDGSFDVVVCGEVLEHLDDDAACVRELYRVLGPGGVVLASVPAGPHRFDWVDEWAGHRRRYRKAELAARFHEAGFADVRARQWGFPLTGLYHRWVYRPLLRRRLAAADYGALGAPTPGRGLAERAVRVALEIDSPFLGRGPEGWFGLFVTARRP